MGRIARNYPKGKLKLRTPKVVQRDKKYPLYIEYNWQADSVRKSTGISIFIKDWNEKGYGRVGEIRPTTSMDYKYYNSSLHKRIEDIDAKIHKYCEAHQHITTDIIRSMFSLLRHLFSSLNINTLCSPSSMTSASHHCE